MGGRIQQLPIGQDATLRARARGFDEGTQTTFTIYKVSDDSEIATVDGQITRGQAVCEWTAEGIDPEEEGSERQIRIYFKARPQGADADITSSEMILYLDWYEVTTVLADGTTTAPDVPVRLKLDTGRGRPRPFEATSNASGVARFENIPPGDLEVEFPSPVRFIDWAEAAKIGKAKAQVKPAFKVQITWPAEDEEGDDGAQAQVTEGGEEAGVREHRQWVNLAPSRSNPEQGSRIRIKVKVHPDDGPGERGDEIFAKLEYPPTEELSKRRARRGFRGRRRNEKKVALRADDGEAVFEIDLGKAGGDAVTIKVGGTEACEDEALKIVNWRKVYYKLIKPTCVTMPANLDHMDSMMEDINVVFEQVGEVDEFGSGDLSGRNANSWQTGEEYSGVEGDADEYFIAGNQNERWRATRHDRSKGRREVSVVMCTAIYDGGARRANRTTTTHRTWNRPQGVFFAPGGNKEIFPKHPLTGEAPLVRGTWRGLGSIRNKRGTISQDWVLNRRETHPGVLVIRFPEGEEPRTLIEAGGSIRVTATYLWAEGGFNAFQWRNELVCSRLPGDRALQIVMLHELGHAMKQAPFTRSPWQIFRPAAALTLSMHGMTYKGHGHQGPHCYEGIDTIATHVQVTDNAGNTSVQAVTGNAHDVANYQNLRTDSTGNNSAMGSCIMWGSSVSTDDDLPTSGFCDTCIPFVKAQSLESVWT